jgi:hypothetical protein
MRDAESVDHDRAIVFAGGGVIPADHIEFHRLTRRNREKRPDVLKIGGDVEGSIRLNQEVGTKVERDEAAPLPKGSKVVVREEKVHVLRTA